MSIKSRTADTGLNNGCETALDKDARASKRRTRIGWTAAAAVAVLIVSQPVYSVPHTLPLPCDCQPMGQLRVAIEGQMTAPEVPESTITIKNIDRTATDTRYIEQVKLYAEPTSRQGSHQPVVFSGETRFHRSRCALLGKTNPETAFASIFGRSFPRPRTRRTAADRARTRPASHGRPRASRGSIPGWHPNRFVHRVLRAMETTR